MAVEKELRVFVHQALSRGVPRAEIEAALAAAGWGQEPVRRALSEFAEVPFPVPVPRPRPYLSARDAFVYLVLFSASVVGVLGFVYWNTVQVIVDQTDATIEAEVRGLAEQYRQRGLPGLVRILRERSQGSAGERGIYLLTGADLTVIAGNLNRWPPAAEPTADGWVDFARYKPIAQRPR